jgi:hypothetical protein
MTMTLDSFKPKTNKRNLCDDPLNPDCDLDEEDEDEKNSRPRGGEKVYTEGSARWSVTGDEMLAKPRPKLRPVDVSSAPRKGGKK